MGCVETGDFGRPRPSVLNDVVLPSIGSLKAGVRGEPVSLSILTDNEREMRDRAWHFIMPAQERSRFEWAIANLVRTRVLPLSMRLADRSAYYHALMSPALRSPASRYRRVSEDAVADARLIGPFVAVATHVADADRLRLRSLAHVRDLAESQVHDAVARVAENRCLVAWVRAETLARLDAYRYALERLVIEAPQTDAIPAERTLAQLAVHREPLDALAGPAVPDALCAGFSETEIVTPAAPPPPPPLITKG